MSYRDRDDHAKETGETRRTLRGMVRRMAVKLTEGVRWQLVGSKSPTGGEEAPHFEIFPGIGFYARPPATGAPEAIANAIAGSQKSRVVVATRDQKTLQAIEAALPGGKLGADETIVFSSAALIHIRANGVVEVRLPGGVAFSLPTLAGVEAMVTKFNQHTHTAHDTPVVAGQQMSNPPGTTVLKAQ